MEKIADISLFLNATKQSGVLPNFISFHDYGSDPTLFRKEVTQSEQIVYSILSRNLPVGITEFNYDCCGSLDPNLPTMTQYWKSVYTGLINAHADFATEFACFNQGGIGDNDLDMFDSNVHPRVIYSVLQNLIKVNSSISIPLPTLSPTPLPTLSPTTLPT